VERGRLLRSGDAANIDDIKFVHAILDDLHLIANIDRRRIYATGFSNGAMFYYTTEV
jgi:poly(3-hydroxybutyrate) depolymerase